MKDLHLERSRQGWGRVLQTGGILFLTGLSAACGNTITCAIQGDNLRGHVLFAEGVEIDSDADIVVQISTDSFASAPMTKSQFHNVNGLVSVPFEACIDNDTSYEVRAFQDTNRDGVLDAGEQVGLYDDTENGNGTPKPISIPGSADNTTWEVKKDINITLDVEHS